MKSTTYGDPQRAEDVKGTGLGVPRLEPVGPLTITSVSLGSSEDKIYADYATKFIAQQKQALIQSCLDAVKCTNLSHCILPHDHSVPNPYLTTLQHEFDRIKHFVLSTTGNQNILCLQPYQQLAVTLIQSIH